MFLPSLTFLNPFGHLIQIRDFITLDCSLMIVMAYIVFCVYYALFKLKFANFFGLYWNKQTDSSSLMFYAMYSCIYKAIVQEFPLHSVLTFYKLLGIKIQLFLKLWGKLISFPYLEKLSILFSQFYS